MASKANSGGLGSILGNAIGNSAGGGIGDILNSVTQGNAGGNAGILGNLANMIDMDKDGNPLDDIMKMIGR